MKINIYYGGRGLMDDPTLFAIGKMRDVLEELHVQVETFHLCDIKSGITTLPQTLKGVDGIILATTVEWFGIGGYMMSFLDACWQYGDKEKISQIYMAPVVMATTYGEREGELSLANAWEILGGLPCSGLCGYVTDATILENNPDYIHIIEKKAENIYRTINQRMTSLPTSNQAVKQKISLTKNTDLTQEEAEQLSQYAADETYVQQSKEDIQELTSYFKNMLHTEREQKTDNEAYLSELRQHFVPQPGMKAAYHVSIEKVGNLTIKVNGTDLQCFYGEAGPYDVNLTLKKETMDEIVCGRMTFQRAFMTGEMTNKGDFGVMRALDIIFRFLN